MTFEPWYPWAAFAVFFIAAELFSLSFYMLVAGISSAIVALVCGLWPLLITVPWQIMMFIAMMLPTTWLLTRRRQHTKPFTDDVGQDPFSGRVGETLEPIHQQQRGRVIFAQALYGTRTWNAYADTPILAGVKVRVVGVSGNTLHVAELTTPQADT